MTMAEAGRDRGVPRGTMDSGGTRRHLANHPRALLGAIAGTHAAARANLQEAAVDLRKGGFQRFIRGNGPRKGQVRFRCHLVSLPVPRGGQSARVRFAGRRIQVVRSLHDFSLRGRRPETKCHTVSSPPCRLQKKEAPRPSRDGERGAENCLEQAYSGLPPNRKTGPMLKRKLFCVWEPNCVRYKPGERRMATRELTFTSKLLPNKAAKVVSRT